MDESIDRSIPNQYQSIKLKKSGGGDYYGTGTASSPPLDDTDATMSSQRTTRFGCWSVVIPEDLFGDTSYTCSYGHEHWIVRTTSTTCVRRNNEVEY
eukprot:scaffold5772_cov188-Amphora_coffeaeformis.AAC.2